MIHYHYMGQRDIYSKDSIILNAPPENVSFDDIYVERKNMAKMESATLKLTVDADYTIIEDDNLAEVQNKVNIHLKLGYLPIGGISIAYYTVGGNPRLWYAQAMLQMNTGLTVSAEVPE